MAKKQGRLAALVVEIAQIPEEGLILDVEVPVESLHLPPLADVVLTTPIRVRGTLARVAEQIYLEGEVRGSLAVPCSRCLETVNTDFVAEVRAVYLPPTADVTSEADLEGGEDLDFYQHNGSTLDLHSLVYDQVVLAFPVQPLCREDCAGLCQVCGGNRNEEPCSCRVEGEDPRLAVLKQLSLPESS